jgi:RecA-family ATPase
MRTDTPPTAEFSEVEVPARGRGERSAANGQAGEPTWRDRLQPRSAADLEGKPVPPRQWLVPHWMPRGHLSSLYGRGGGGKTTLIMQYGMACSAGGFWLGMQVPKLRVAGLFCEDDEDELHRKLSTVAEAMNRPLSAFKNFTYLPRLGLENLLVAKSRAGLVTTPFYDDMKTMIGDTKPDLLLGDGIADLFGGNVNDPTESTYFINAFIGLMRPTKGSAVLLGHPNKAGTSEFTGCGAWENKPRSRLYLAPPPAPENGEEPDLNDPRRVLMRSKANYAAKDSLELVWRDGVFRVADPKLMSLNERCALEARQHAARDAFLDALGQLDGMQVHVSHSPNAGNYAVKVFLEHSLADGFSKRELREALNQLLNDRRVIANEPVGWSGNRNKLTGLKRVVP